MYIYLYICMCEYQFIVSAYTYMTETVHVHLWSYTAFCTKINLFSAKCKYIYIYNLVTINIIKWYIDIYADYKFMNQELQLI